MKRIGIVLLLLFAFITTAKSEGGLDATLSKGLSFTASDNSFGLKLGLVVQPRISYYADLPLHDSVNVKDYSELEIRRLRLRFDGFVGCPSLRYSVQLGFSNRDMESIKGPNDEQTGVVYDAFIDWEFIEKTTLRVGQAKLPGSLSRLMSFTGLNFLERSYAEGRFNTYRDVGIQVLNEWNVSDFTVREQLAVSQGEGVNVRSDANGGLAYSGRLEIYPLGLFEKGGETYEMDRQFEKTPKLLLGGAFFLDAGAMRDRSVLGKALYQKRDIQQIFGDLLFKWNGFALMGEFYKRDCDEPFTTSSDNKSRYVYVGQGIAGQVSYMISKDHAFALRFSQVAPDDKIIEKTGNRTDYSIGFTQFLYGNKVKLQFDASYYEQEIFEKDPGKNYELRTNLLFSF